ncbi:uncharacterized protein An01g05020 [Aspergillus niger]|uniref:Contig An01c0170, genomic contig n=2 Tax=Aspergillus niger TaxID=5061 RepID=A2Q8N9_ASPNC|nr:uncharacterized protein An01g05020 [Aspergillus niger]CAK37036.1 unnamed protein product [Aspergillus niger]
MGSPHPSPTLPPLLPLQPPTSYYPNRRKVTLCMQEEKKNHTSLIHGRRTKAERVQAPVRPAVVLQQQQQQHSHIDDDDAGWSLVSALDPFPFPPSLPSTSAVFSVPPRLRPPRPSLIPLFPLPSGPCKTRTIPPLSNDDEDDDDDDGTAAAAL